MHILEYEKITIYEVESFYKQLLDWCQNEKEMDLDMGNVQKVDFAGIQLLIAAQKSVGLKLHNVSSNNQRLFDLAGVKPLLMEEK